DSFCWLPEGRRRKEQNSTCHVVPMKYSSGSVAAKGGGWMALRLAAEPCRRTVNSVKPCVPPPIPAAPSTPSERSTASLSRSWSATAVRRAITVTCSTYTRSSAHPGSRIHGQRKRRRERHARSKRRLAQAKASLSPAWQDGLVHGSGSGLDSTSIGSLILTEDTPLAPSRSTTRMFKRRVQNEGACTY